VGRVWVGAGNNLAAGGTFYISVLEGNMNKDFSAFA